MGEGRLGACQPPHDKVYGFAQAFERSLWTGESEIQNRPGEVTELGRRHAELQRRGAGRSGRDGKQSEAKEQNVQKDIGENR